MSEVFGNTNDIGVQIFWNFLCFMPRSAEADIFLFFVTLLSNKKGQFDL